jgi:hypothetical protein
MNLDSHPIPAERIERRILLVRGQKVLLDFHLAELYEVETRSLNQAVKRNRNRFPEDFMFQLSEEESDRIVRSRPPNPSSSNSSQSVMSCLQSETGDQEASASNEAGPVTGSRKHRGLTYRPYAFTEQGVAMLSSVLRSPRAVLVSIAIMRTFVQLRQLLSSHSDLAKKLATLESRYDRQFKVVFDAIRELTMPATVSQKPEIGFHTGFPRRSPKSNADGKSKPSNRKSKLS